MSSMRYTGLHHALALSLFVVGCGGGSDIGGNIELQKFDTSLTVPANQQPLSHSENSELMSAIKYRGFESEFPYQQQRGAPHIYSWHALDLNDYAGEGRSTQTLNCEDIALQESYSDESTGQGTLSINSTMHGNYVGYLELEYVDCVINDNAYTGTVRITVNQEPRDHPSGKPAADFYWEYEDYFWGIGGLDYYLDGKVGYKNSYSNLLGRGEAESLSNYRFVARQGERFELTDLATRCSEERYDSTIGDYSWRCDVASGSISLDQKGMYPVKTIEPFYRTLWRWGAKLEFTDDGGQRYVYWGDSEQEKRLTVVDTNGGEQSFRVSYNIESAAPVYSQTEVADASIAIRSSLPKKWSKELYAADTDEVILFDESMPRAVEAITLSSAQQRTIDLVEPAFDVSVLGLGDLLTSGHDGGVRSIFLKDPNETSQRRQIGFGKIVEIYDEQVVAYTSPASTLKQIVSFTWSGDSQQVLESRELNRGDNAFDYQSGVYANGLLNAIEFGSSAHRNYSTNYVHTGAIKNYVKLFNNSLLLTGGGNLLKCTGSCLSSAVSWLSINDVIAQKYPDAGEQTVVDASTDTEDFYEFNDPSLLLVTTVASEFDGDFDDGNRPLRGTNLWAIDLNNTQRVQKLQLPTNDYSVPAAELRIHRLFKERPGTGFVGVGSWALDSGSENTVLFSVDPDQITYR